MKSKSTNFMKSLFNFWSNEKDVHEQVLSYAFCVFALLFTAMGLIYIYSNT
jgi:hypothetical protein